MTLLLGPRAAVDIMSNVGGIDPVRVMAFQNRNGLTPQQVIELAGAAIGAMNAQIMADYGNLINFTEATFARYRNGEGSVGMTPRKNDFVPADAIRGQETGNMLPLYDHEDRLDWTAIYLRDAYLSTLETDLQVAAERWYNRFDNDILFRMLSIQEVLWGTGYVVPFAIGTGVNVPYIPPQYRTKTFDSTHSHFNFNTGTTAADYASLLKKMIRNLAEHGITGDKVAIVSYDDIDKYTAMTGFEEIKAPQVSVITGGSSQVRVVDGTVNGVPGETFGYFNSVGNGRVELRSWASMPTTYAFLFRPYGENNGANPFAVRRHPDVPFGLIPDIQITSSMTPEINGIALKATFGVGVNSRLNGVAGCVNQSSYVDPYAA